MIIFDDVALAAEPIKPAQVAALLGFKSPGHQVGQLRSSGRKISIKRLDLMIQKLLAMAEAIEILKEAA